MKICDLYHFQFDDGPEYFYTSADADIEYDGETWEAVPLKRGRPSGKFVGEHTRSNLEIEMDSIDTDVVREWDGPGPTREARVDIYTADRDDISGTITQQFPGKIIEIRRQGKTATIVSASRIIDAAKKGPRGHFSNRCRWRLYGEGCGLDAEDVEFNGDVQSTTEEDREVVIRIDHSGASPGSDDFFVGGYLEFGGVSRRIVSQDGPTEVSVDIYEYTLSVVYWIDGLDTATSVTVAPGCDRTFKTCAERFFNWENFGGFPHQEQVGESPYGIGYAQLGSDS